MDFLPFKIEVNRTKVPKIDSIVKTDYYLVYKGTFGKAVYFEDEFVLDTAIFLSPAEHLYGERRFAMELKLQGYRGVERVEFVALFDEIADKMDLDN